MEKIGLLALLVVLPGSPSFSQSHTIQSEVHGNLVYLPVSVNGSSPLWFILDSGSDSFVLDSSRAIELGLKPAGHITPSGIGDQSVRAQSLGHVSLNVNGIEFSNQSVVVVTLAQLEAVVGRRVDGVLGSAVFQRFVVEIDYVTHAVTFSDPGSYAYSGTGERIPLNFKNGTPLAEIRIELPNLQQPATGRFVVDTGGNNAFAVVPQFSNRYRFKETLTAAVSKGSFGAKGAIEQGSELVARVPAVTIGRYRLKKPLVAFSTKPAGADLGGIRGDGQFGGEILSRFKVILDFHHRALYLEPNTHFDDPFQD